MVIKNEHDLGLMIILLETYKTALKLGEKKNCFLIVYKEKYLTVGAQNYSKC
jgi:hypothetical protein